MTVLKIALSKPGLAHLKQNRFILHRLILFFNIAIKFAATGILFAMIILIYIYLKQKEKVAWNNQLQVVPKVLNVINAVALEEISIL